MARPARHRRRGSGHPQPRQPLISRRGCPGAPWRWSVETSWRGRRRTRLFEPPLLWLAGSKLIVTHGMIQMIPRPGRPLSETLKLRSASARSLAATHPCDLLHAVVRFAGNHIMGVLGAATAPWPCALSSRFVVYLFFLSSARSPALCLTHKGESLDVPAHFALCAGSVTAVPICAAGARGYLAA